MEALVHGATGLSAACHEGCGPLLSAATLTDPVVLGGAGLVVVAVVAVVLWRRRSHGRSA